MTQVLLVEDDASLAFGMEYTLSGEGFAVMVAGTLAEARRHLTAGDVDLILLDINLPDGSGYELCKEIRASSQIPVIFLTALDEEVNVVAGLDLGADDYMTKPIRTKELVSRIKAVLRRNINQKQQVNVWLSQDIEVRVLEGAVYKYKQQLVLTGLEYKLLLMLITHPRQICSRSAILHSLWDMSGEFIDDNTLSVHIRRLREKVEDTPAAPQYIITVRGVGYKWNMDVSGR